MILYKSFLLGIGTAVLASFLVTTSTSAQHVTTVISDGCIATAGYPIAKDKMFELEVGELKKDKPANRENAIASVLATSLATTVIENLFEKGSNYIKAKATDSTFDYDSVFPSSLYVAKLSSDTDEELRFGIKLNPHLRCFTVVLNSSAVPTSGHEVQSQEILKVSKWQALNWPNWGPTKIELLKRLKSAGLAATGPNNTINEPMLVFEAVMQFSADGKAVQFVPRYFRVFRFVDKGTAIKKRSVGINLTIDIPGQTAGTNSSQLIQHSFNFVDVEAARSKDMQTVGGIKTEYGFGPLLVGAIINQQEWIKFTTQTYEVPDYVAKQFLAKNFDEKSRLQLEPLNIRSTVEIAEKASQVAVFLAKFVEEHSVTTTLSSALIQELGLITDEEKKTQLIAKITAEKNKYEYWRDQYIEKLPNAADHTEVVALYNEKIDALTTELNKLENGCDPLNKVPGASCN
ncbi:hypothetical protein [Sulfitobacter sp. CW3]|uniref:hypothetical protein n=1 Tax=Sulfitobacter sp. CW3 TaxID=2861965 RepID=UPI001C5D7D2C|nr:hypothetical protein [Sulfitobacter sp. CW3]MBW4963969.1 hypothetical protein [Sulfitobacter sp. CW3]